jgi:hypothetical protein
MKMIFKERAHSLLEVISQRLLWRAWGIPREAIINIVGVPVEIRTELLNFSLECWSYAIRSVILHRYYEKTPWPKSVSELYRPSDRRLSAKFVPTFADRWCYVVSVTVPYGRTLVSLDRNRYFFFKVAPHLYSRGWMDPVPDPLLLWISDSAGNRTRTSVSVARNSGH